MTRPFTFRHALADDAFVNRATLTDLAGTLPDANVEHHVASLPLVLPGGVPPRLPLTARQVARDLDHNGCWILLSNLDQFAAAAPMCAVVRNAVAPRIAEIEARDGAVVGTDVTGLLGAPGARVPVHFDNHHVLLMQVAGTKTVHVGWYEDPTVGQRAIERNLLPPHVNADTVPETHETFTLGPGDGLAIPPMTFHWVVGGEGVSVAVSVAVHTPLTTHVVAVHIANASLRRFGLRPRVPGARPTSDHVKVMALRARNRLRGRHVDA